ncbi:MAG: hypothetical protein HY721_14975, partial [Planctomycetes bacterium]|nr:hypothetical protein [Planctomycetota bacterium]
MPLKTEDPQTQETYLCVVSEWQGGKNSGNCYPVFVLSKGRILKEPDSQFPNAGAVFLPSRRGKVFDLISLRPVLNPTYKDQNYRDCYFVPLVNSIHYPTREELLGVHTVLAVPSFDPDVRQIPHPAQLVTPVFFVRDLSKGGRLIGPLRCVEVRRSSLGETVEWIAWRAESDEGLAWTFPESALGSNGLKLEVYQHPRPDLNDILARPFEFLVGKLGEGIAGGEPLDLAAAEDLVRFYQRVGGIAIPQELTSALASIPSREGTERPAYLRSRFDRLRRLLTNAAQLEDERRRIAGEFLKTEQGKLQVSALIAQAKEEARVAVRTELNVEGERRRLQAELDALAARKAALEAELAAEKGRREKDLESLESTISELKGAAGLEAESLRKRVFEALPGLVAISAGAAAPEARAPSSEAAEDRAQRSSGVEIRPLPAPRPFRQVEDEALYVRWLRDELARTG